MYARLRPWLFRLDPERAHYLTVQLLRLGGRLPPVSAWLRRMFDVPVVPVHVLGLRFSNPVGLAAGYDKDGLAWRGLACLGFGHIEVGTVTPRPQAGNPRPRVFRIPEVEALVNRMGFPGEGAAFVAGHLHGRRPEGLVLGVNLGKNKDTPLELAASDYLELMEVFAPLADYLAINVSSPNTVGLRRLQARQALKELLVLIRARRDDLADDMGRRVPVLVKLAPDLDRNELEDALAVILELGLDGVIATNTTLGRYGLDERLVRARETGGLSGAPLQARSTEIIRQIVAYSGGTLPVIGVGGILDADDAQEKLEAGAALVQVYTGLVYRGPGLVGELVRGLARTVR